MSDSRAITAKPKRRWFRFSLRTLLIVVTIFGVWLGIVANRARTQREVTEWIDLQYGSEVLYDWQCDEDGNLVSNAAPPRPDWLRERVGADFFQTVVEVRMHLGNSGNVV